MPHLHSLHIALNRYHPDSGVPSLNGCEADIRSMQDWLHDRMRPVFQENWTSTRLLNEQATRSEIIRAWREYLIRPAAPGDTVLVQHSGHGSHHISASAFWQSDPKKQDQTLVCYDSRLPGGFDLANKEIAVLLAQFRPGVHVVLLADSCHSGALTRTLEDSEEEELVSRLLARQSDRERPLASYLDGWYAALSKPHLAVPESEHLLFSACNREQFAYERRGRGLFTQTLLEVLEATGGNITYADLHRRAKAVIGRYHSNQTPTLDVFGNVSPHRFFLTAAPQRKNWHFVSWKNERWQMDFGAVHGLQATDSAEKQIALSLYERLPGGLPTAAMNASIKEVRLNHSELQMECPDRRKVFNAEIIQLPKPTLVFYLKGTAALRSRWLDLKNDHSPFYDIISSPEQAKYEVVLEPDRLLIRNGCTGKLIHGAWGFDERAVQYLCSILDKIEKWERLLAARNPVSHLGRQIDFWLELYSQEACWQRQPGAEIQVSFDGVHNVPFRVCASNGSGQDLHLVSLQFTRQFGILSKLHQDFKLPAYAREVTLQENAFIILGNDAASFTSFKLIASTHPIDPFPMVQDALKLGEMVSPVLSRDLAGDDPVQQTEDWQSLHIAVEIVRQGNH